MKFDPIDFYNPDQVATRIEELEKLDLSKIGWIPFNVIAKNSFLIPHNTTPFLQFKIYRGLLNDGMLPFNSKKRISYNPNPSSDFGRASWPNENVFYASNTGRIAALETCQGQLRNKFIHEYFLRKEYFLTIGEWLADKTLENVNLVCHSKQAQNSNQTILLLCQSLNNLIKEQSKTEDEYKSRILINEFFAKQFAKPEINSTKDYLFSAYWSSYILNSTEPAFDGICYPSVANKYEGLNFALQTKLIDDGTVYLNKVYFVKICFSNMNKLSSFDLISATATFDGDKIIW